MNLKTKLSALLLAPALCLAAAAPAAASYEIGQTLPPYKYAQCGGAIAMQTAVAPGFASYSVPNDGVITSWGTATATYAGTAKLKILRPTGLAGQYLVVGEDGPHTVAAETSPVFTGIRIPVRAGDSIALLATGTNCLSWTQSPVYKDSFFTPGSDPAPGANVSVFSNSTEWAIDVRATVESDADGDGFGDETQDQCPANAAAQVPPCVAPPAALPSAAAPRLTLRGRPVQAALKKGAVVEIAEADQAVSLRATGALTIAGKRLPLLAAAASGAAGERTHLALRIPKATKRRVRLALVEGKKVRAVLEVSATNTSAGSALATQKIAIGPGGHRHH